MESILVIEYAALMTTDIDMHDVRLGQLTVLAIALAGIVLARVVYLLT